MDVGMEIRRGCMTKGRSDRLMINLPIRLETVVLRSRGWLDFVVLLMPGLYG